MHTAERLWRQRVRAVFRRGGVSSNDIEDLCQEVAISYFQIRGVAPWDDTSAQPHLVAHLIKSTLSDYFAQLRRYSELLRRYASYVVLAQTPEDSVKKPDLISKLSELPPNLREIVEMKVVEGYTFPEISALTSCPEGTVKARYYKGIAILRKALQQETTFWSTLGINIIETGDKEAQNNHASQDVGEDSATSGSAGGGMIPLLAGTAIYRHEAQREGCGGTSQMSAITNPYAWALNLFMPTGVIVTCPLQGSDFTTPDQWCQRVVNSDCDGWLGSRADYLRQRNKCWWDMGTGYFLVTCGQWQPWDCCYEQDATPEPPCPRNRYQIYCVPNTPQQCP